MKPDQEINALSYVFEALKELDKAQIKRIIDWVTDKFGLKEEKTGGTVVPQPDRLPVEAVQPTPGALIEKPKRGKRSRGVPSAPEGLIPGSPGVKDFENYDSIKDLFSAARVNTLSSKILLAAVYLQEKLHFTAFSSADITSNFKVLKVRVQNISASINNLLNKKPPLLIQVGKMGDRPQSRRKYKVTEHGLSVARGYLEK